MKIAFAINVCFLVMAQLETWLPITFRMFAVPKRWFTYCTRFFLFMYFGIKIANKTKDFPSNEEIYDATYGTDPIAEVRVTYRINWISFIFFQFILFIIGYFLNR
jgi:hypothetical protein